MPDSIDPNEQVVECPAGDENCPHVYEIKKLREENKELASLVRLDDLTGLFNFRHFNQSVELEMERSRRSNKPTVLIMIDLDFFKEVNDEHGHEIGNHALEYVAKIIRNTVRRLDTPCRYGGEEFAIILPDTPLNAGVLFANRLRLKIEDAHMEIEGHNVRLTASFGVDVYKKENNCTARDFIERADALLYVAKTKGRNQVCHPALGVNKE